MLEQSVTLLDLTRTKTAVNATSASILLSSPALCIVNFVQDYSLGMGISAEEVLATMSICSYTRESYGEFSEFKLAITGKKRGKSRIYMGGRTLISRYYDGEPVPQDVSAAVKGLSDIEADDIPARRGRDLADESWHMLSDWRDATRGGDQRMDWSSWLDDWRRGITGFRRLIVDTDQK
jgi:hypothetical protein